MGVKRAARSLLQSFGYEIYNKRQPHIWSEDGMSTHHNFSFIKSPRFQSAYARAVKANDEDHHIRWRAHVALWVARQAAALEGDFVECGVSTGFLASAIMHDLDWNNTGKNFYMFDTWEGLDPRFLSDNELKADRLGWYADLSLDKVKANFAEFRNVHFQKGTVPETLDEVTIEKVCYLSLDMNCTAPEIAAIEHFWPKIVPGGMILMDDYCYSGYEEQHDAFDLFADRIGTTILSLPTGQGLIQKSFSA